MDCGKVQFKIGLLLDGRLASREEALVMEHVRCCAICREEFAFQKAAAEALGAAESVEPAEGGWERLVKRIEAEERPRPRALPRPGYALAAAAAVLIGITLWQYSDRTPDRPRAAVREAVKTHAPREQRIVSAERPSTSPVKPVGEIAAKVPAAAKRTHAMMAYPKSTRRTVEHRGAPPVRRIVRKQDLQKEIPDAPAPEIEADEQPETRTASTDVSEQLDDTLARGLMVLVEAAGSDAGGVNHL